jgi:hypothetical protein
MKECARNSVPELHHNYAAQAVLTQHFINIQKLKLVYEILFPFRVSD